MALPRVAPVERRIRVGHYGGGAADGLSADDRCTARRIEGAAAVEPLDCLLVDWAETPTPRAAVAAGVRSGTPVVVYDPDGRPSRAAAATRADATEYVAPAALSEETVADRVVATARVTAANGDGVPRERPDAAGHGPTDPASPVDRPGGPEEATTQAAGRTDPDRRRFARFFDGLPDAVVEAEFVDGEPVVRSVNEAFETTFGIDAADARGDPVNELLVPEEYAEEAASLDSEAASAGHSIQEVERPTARGRRTFLFRWLRYPTDDVRRGFGIYTDITDRKRQKRRLRVLHRVLRHNLRNEVTAMQGDIDFLADDLADDDRRTYVENLRDRADSIAALGEQAEDIETALDDERRTRRVLDPAAVARQVCAETREAHPAATIRFDAPADPACVLADSLLGRAVEELVENAVVHDDGDPTVTVSVEPADDRWIDVVVDDDGPGIPARERELLGGDREITQLDHSMGLGLWIARWIVTGVDGRLCFDDSRDGSTVRLRLERADASP
jgi:PAS domain S-box-containing protein